MASTTSFPSHSINPKEKDAKWFSDFSKAIWNNWLQIQTKSFAQGVTRYNRIKYYRLAKQPIDPYLPHLNIKDKDNQSWMAIDMTPIPIIPKLVRIINSLFRKVEMTPEVIAIDPYSEEDKREAMRQERAAIKMRAILEQAQQQGGEQVLNNGDPQQPMNMEELAIYEQFTWKHNLSMKIEQALDKVFFDNDMDEQRETCRESLIEYGAAGFRIQTCENGKVETRPVDITCFISSYTGDQFMRDIWYAGEITYVLVSELRKKLPNVPEYELEDLARKNMNGGGNPMMLGTGTPSSYNYDSVRIPVLDLTFKTWNMTTYEKRKLNTKENFVIGKTDKPKNDTEKRTYYKDENTDICKVCWVMETDHIYDWGYENAMVKKASKYWDSVLPFIMVAPTLFKMETTSLVEELIPIVDAIHIAWYKLQNVIAQARPKGIIINIDALENVSLVGNGEINTPLQLIDLFTQKGILVYREMDAAGNPTKQAPVKELNNGLGNEANEYYSLIERHMAMIKSMIGLNDFTDASTPDPKALAGVGELAAEATNNALHHIFNGERNILERMSDNAAQRVYDSIMFMKSPYYDKSIGKSAAVVMSKVGNSELREFGIKIRMSPTAQEKAKLEADVSQALVNREITIADKYFILNINNIKQASQVLAYRVKKNAEDMHAKEMEKIQATTEQQKEAAMLAEEEKRKTLQMEVELKTQLINVEWDRRDQNLRIQIGGEGLVKGEQNDTKKIVQAMSNQSQQQQRAAKAVSKGSEVAA